MKLSATRREFLDALAPRIYFHFYFLFYFRNINPLKINEISLLDWIVFREIYVYLQRILQRMQHLICSIILPNWNLEGDLRAKLISVEAVHKRRLLHRILEAVPGLAGYMAGLRFLMPVRLVLILQTKGYE